MDKKAPTWFNNKNVPNDPVPPAIALLGSSPPAISKPVKDKLANPTANLFKLLFLVLFLVLLFYRTIFVTTI